jgi:hypothetical protein
MSVKISDEVTLGRVGKFSSTRIVCARQSAIGQVILMTLMYLDPAIGIEILLDKTKKIDQKD